MSATEAGRQPRSRRTLDLRGRGRMAVIGGVLLGLIGLLSIVVPFLSGIDPNAQRLALRLLPPALEAREGIVSLFGTDALGRDIMTRVFVGGRYSFAIGITASMGALLIGTVAGLVSGYFGGFLDAVLMRIVDLQLAFPLVLLALALVALFGPSVRNVIIVFIVTSWPIFARTVRSSTLSLKERAFVEAAVGSGAGTFRILARHVLPNARGPLVVLASFQLASVMIYEAALGFLGLGVQPPTPTWGAMIADGRQYLDTAWWVIFFPGITLVFAAAAANWLGDGLNHLTDPREAE
jgi:peptide/nickel transport system permease protein